MYTGTLTRARWGTRAAPRRLVDLVLVVGALAFAAVTVLTLAARWHWIADLVANFRPHLLVAGLGFAFLALAAGWRRLALLTVALAMAHGLWLLPRQPTAAVPADGVALRVTTFNVLFSNERFRLVRAWLEANGADVVVLQEFEDEWLTQKDRLRDLYPFGTLDLRGGHDMVVLSRYPVRDASLVRPPDPEGRPIGNPALRVTLEIEGRPLVVYGVHPPHPMSAREWAVRNALHEGVARRAAAEPPGVPVLIAGDFNQTPWTPFHQAMLRTSGMVDAAGSVLQAPTRSPAAAPPWRWLGIPIDHILVTPGIAVRSYEVGPWLGSDHFPVTADLVVPRG